MPNGVNWRLVVGRPPRALRKKSERTRIDETKAQKYPMWVPVGDDWILRHRERVSENGVIRTINRAQKLAKISPECKTRAAARKLAEETFLPLIQQRRKIDPTHNLIAEECVEKRYLPHAQSNLRASTYNSYKSLWRLYVKPRRIARMWLGEIETHHLQALLEDVARETLITRTTLGHLKHFLSGVFRFAAQQGFVDSRRANPVTLTSIPAFAPKGREGEAYSLEEITAMLKLLDDGTAATAIATAAYSGLRLGELRGLCWQDYTPAQDAESFGSIHVKRSIWRSKVNEPKTERSKGIVPVIPALAVRLERHRNAQGNPASGPIFASARGTPMSLDRLYWLQMRDVFKKAGIPWRGWHGFRRGLASNLNRLGVDDSVIQAILRHSNVAVTQACYIKTARPDAVEAMRKFAENLASAESRSLLVLKNGAAEPKGTIQ